RVFGYKTPRYLQFGWCGARLDDVMNFVPARLTAVFIAAIASALPDCAGRKAVRIALAQHAWLPSPNSGWSEAAAAGALQRRLVGPIWRSGERVADIWVGARWDPTLATERDVRRALVLVAATGVAAATAACATLRATGFPVMRLLVDSDRPFSPARRAAREWSVHAISIRCDDGFTRPRSLRRLWRRVCSTTRDLRYGDRPTTRARRRERHADRVR